MEKEATTPDEAARAKRDSTLSRDDAPVAVGDEKEEAWQQRFSKSITSTTKAFKQLLKKDDDYFHSLFKHIPASEKLLDDFSCALQREILVHGRLYVSQSFLCFYSNIFGWETMLTLPCTDIVDIRKEKVAFLIPNAIEVRTKDTNHFFASFAQRDMAHRCLHAVWQNAQRPTPLKPEQLVEAFAKDWRDPPRGGSSENLEGSPRRSSGAVVMPPLLLLDGSVGAGGGAGDGDTASIASDLSFTSASAVPQAPAIDVITVADTYAGAGGAGTGGNDDTGPVECGCREHPGRVTLDKVAPCSVEAFCAAVFTDTPVFRELYAQRRTNDLVIGTWAMTPGGPDGSTHPKREMTYVLSLNYSIGPKTAKANEIQWELACAPGARRIIEAEVSTPNVPYGDNFYTYSRYCITRRTAQSCRVLVTTEIRYRKGAPWAVAKSIIERNTYEGVANYLNHLFDNVCKASHLLDSAAVTAAPSREPEPPEPMDVAPQPATALVAAAMPSSGSLPQAAKKTHSVSFPIEPPALAPVGRPLLWLVVLLLLINFVLAVQLWRLDTTPAAPSVSAAMASVGISPDDQCYTVCRAAVADYGSMIARSAAAFTEQAHAASTALNEMHRLMRDEA